VGEDLGQGAYGRRLHDQPGPAAVVFTDQDGNGGPSAIDVFGAGIQLVSESPVAVDVERDIDVERYLRGPAFDPVRRDRAMFRHSTND
jgi:hypothetical protein